MKFNRKLVVGVVAIVLGLAGAFVLLGIFKGFWSPPTFPSSGVKDCGLETAPFTDRPMRQCFLEAFTTCTPAEARIDHTYQDSFRTATLQIKPMGNGSCIILHASRETDGSLKYFRYKEKCTRMAHYDSVVGQRLRLTGCIGARPEVLF